jgi:hypothetical protein
MRSPSTDVLAERLEQLRGIASVLPKRRLFHPAMCLKPVAERGHKSWIGLGFPNWFTRADPALN